MSAWEEYTGAAQRLDAVRRGAAAAVAEQAGAAQAAQSELALVRERLRAEHARLVQAGVPAEQLAPTEEEIAAAGAGLRAGPVAVRETLRRAQSTVDAAAAALVSGGPGAPGGGLGAAPLWLRNLAVYGPFAFVVLVIQVALYLVVDEISVPAALCGLAMPLAAFGLGWLAIGLAFPDERAPGGGRQPVRRTPLFGALVCLAPTLLTCALFGALSVFR
ncbi:hypothetical protein [Rhizomonospora bruguierae]|uniref:hypothetical protein n=1 Tax=Rhizomonospora bruguierae TaxID=1581705 RepID=UPI001BD17F4E|nr:hypothetical protein [Micromonospora sp. NBRC 107566]